MSVLNDKKLLAPWIKKIPDGWACVRTDSLADVLFSNVDKHTYDEEVPVRLCNYVDVYKNERITNDISFMEASASKQEIDRFQIKKGDILLTKDSESPDDIAICALVAEELPNVICGYHLALIRSRSSHLKGSFLACVHKSKAFLAQYEAKAVGVTRFGLSQYAFRSARIPLPSEGEQNLITKYLDQQCAAIDKAISIKKEQLQVLDELRKSIIHKAVTKGLDDSVAQVDSGVDWIGKTPKHWKVKRVKRFAKVKRGASPRPIEDQIYFDEDGEFAWVRISDVTASERYLETTEQLLSQLGSSLSVKQYPGDLFISIAGTVGKPIITKIKCCIHDGFIWFENPQFNKEFLWYIFISEAPYQGLGKLGTQLNLNTATVGQIFIPVPSLEEQARIVRDLDQRCGDLRILTKNIEEQIATLEAYRKSLIHEYVTGKRRITEQDLKEMANV